MFAQQKLLTLDRIDEFELLSALSAFQVLLAKEFLRQSCWARKGKRSVSILLRNGSVLELATAEVRRVEQTRAHKNRART
jgi:hypothetical protein